jgi:4-hydroxy-tetrahydrodipicolinate reductase
MVPREAREVSDIRAARRGKMPNIRVVVTGACGKMGMEVVKAVNKEDGMCVTGAVDRASLGQDIGRICGLGELGVKVTGSITEALALCGADVMVDFTVAEAAVSNIEEAICQKLRWVVGTTGIAKAEIDRLMEKSAKSGVGGILAPNFAIGAVLMMSLSKIAARFMPECEIIELHHDRKLDAPSGTSKATAAALADVGASSRSGSQQEPPARGGEFDGIRIHSVRLPGLVAHQEVIFGGLGQILTIRHDSMGRESFMPGVVLAIKKAIELDKPVFGLERVLGLDF